MGSGLFGVINNGKKFTPGITPHQSKDIKIYKELCKTQQ